MIVTLSTYVRRSSASVKIFVASLEDVILPLHVELPVTPQDRESIDARNGMRTCLIDLKTSFGCPTSDDEVGLTHVSKSRYSNLLQIS
jgi:hypothetical protein